MLALAARGRHHHLPTVPVPCTVHHAPWQVFMIGHADNQTLLGADTYVAEWHACTRKVCRYGLHQLAHFTCINLRTTCAHRTGGARNAGPVERQHAWPEADEKSRQVRGLRARRALAQCACVCHGTHRDGLDALLLAGHGLV